jgi:hypothetical protein
MTFRESWRHNPAFLICTGVFLALAVREFFMGQIDRCMLLSIMAMLTADWANRKTTV